MQLSITTLGLHQCFALTKNISDSALFIYNWYLRTAIRQTLHLETKPYNSQQSFLAMSLTVWFLSGSSMFFYAVKWYIVAPGQTIIQCEQLVVQPVINVLLTEMTNPRVLTSTIFIGIHIMLVENLHVLHDPLRLIWGNRNTKSETEKTVNNSRMYCTSISGSAGNSRVELVPLL